MCYLFDYIYIEKFSPEISILKTFIEYKFLESSLVIEIDSIFLCKVMGICFGCQTILNDTIQLLTSMR